MIVIWNHTLYHRVLPKYMNWYLWHAKCSCHNTINNPLHSHNSMEFKFSQVIFLKLHGRIQVSLHHQTDSSTHVIPLSHYSRNAPRIHNVGHIFQIANVPSVVCKIRPAFLLDSATFLAIANARGNVQGGSCMSGRYFIFFKIRELVKNPIQQTYKRTNTIRWSKNPTGH